MAIPHEPKPPEWLKGSWYDLTAQQLQALIPKFRVEQSSAELYRAYDLICRESLGLHPGARAMHISRLNHDGTPIQFALALGGQTTPLQFLSEAGDPGLSYTETREFIEERVRTLSELLRLKGDMDSVAALLRRGSAVNAHASDPDRGGAFWIGASFAAVDNAGLKIYINGKTGSEDERWTRLDDFAAYFGALENQQELKRLVIGKMTPLGMAVVLSQDESPAGRIYFSGYGNRLSYYEDLLRHFVGEYSLKVFRQYTELMLAEDCAYPTQCVVFSARLSPSTNQHMNVKIEFCGHCLFQSDEQARDRFLRWLELRRIDARAYEELLDVICGQMSPKVVNSHIYLGLGWKRQDSYTTIYLKPHFAE